ncbi:nitrogen fixation protein FixH [Chryseobacterium lacus]|uniref:Nitrogen fixation protein FixH n=1 Tax=Chryseobacterium lacus TaxID=2058346 RepID=A0A368N399_9FLAO|nr:FixH family protein [Chryseobacterium lacus]RCU44094.1 nitrogen fixation protein FixH [Chryseobacterium lacus]RST29025.1 nitrogen fixation protein FixH [Chryseobacterium lacus]
MLKNFTWGHGIVVALGSFMIFILSLIWYFTSTWKNSELITDNYYEEELAYQNVIDAKNKATNLKELPVYHQNESGISVTFPSEINNSNSKFRIDLHRAEDQKLDIIREMELDQRNSIFIPAKVLAKGNYVLRVMWKKDNEEYQIDYDLIW